MNVGNRLRKRVPSHVYEGLLASDPPRPAFKPRVTEAREVAEARWGFLQTLETLDLLRVQAAAIDELRTRGVVRTANAPLGDYAEDLFRQAYEWKLEGNSSAAFDAQLHGIRYQIKARRVRANASGERQLGIIRNLPAHGFDFLAAVLFDGEFNVLRAAIIPYEVVAAKARHMPHVNGWRFVLDDNVWHLKGVEDATSKLSAAARALLADGAGTTFAC